MDNCNVAGWRYSPVQTEYYYYGEQGRCIDITCHDRHNCCNLETGGRKKVNFGSFRFKNSLPRFYFLPRITQIFTEGAEVFINPWNLSLNKTKLRNYLDFF